jgi:hypothetical protein
MAQAHLVALSLDARRRRAVWAGWTVYGGGGADEGVVGVPIFLVERRFAEDLEESAEVADRINRINEEEGVRWLYSFLSADKRKTYCLYEAPVADAIRRAAARAGLPADAVIELGARVLPDGSMAGLSAG